MPLDEDDMLQFAIEQSLNETSGAGGGAVAGASNVDTEKVDIWEALRGQGVGSDAPLLAEEDEQLQR